MRRGILICCAAILMVGCGSTTPERPDYHDYMEPPAFLKVEIEERIAALPYQSGEELMLNMTRLIYIGEPAIPALLDGLESVDARARGSCAYVLGQIKDRRTIPSLVSVLDDPEASVRYEVATALCIMGERDGYPVLIDGLSDPDIRNRYKAHEALQLLTRLNYGYRHDDDPGSRQVAVRKWQQWWERMRASSL